METRASYVAVGTFVIGFVVALVAFAVWLGGSRLAQEVDRYLLFVSESPAGLQIGSPVRYRGLGVGTVAEVGLDPQNNQQIRVLVEIAVGTPVLEGAAASFERSGITGGVFVQISGGEAGSAELEPPVDRPYPVIPTRPGQLDQVITSIPEALRQATLLMERARGFLSEENQRSLTEILVNIQTLTEGLAERTDSLTQVVDNVDSLISNLDSFLVSTEGDVRLVIQQLGETLEAVNREATLVSTEVQAMASSFSGTADEATLLLSDLRPDLRDFASTGLYEITLTIGELRVLAQNLARLLDRFETGGASVLFGDTDTGVPIQ